MGSQAMNQGWDRAVYQSELYPSDVLTTHGSWLWDPLGNLWALLVKTSGVGYTLFGIACGFKVFTWLLGVYWRLTASPLDDRLTFWQHVCVSLMPSYLQRLDATWRLRELQAAAAHLTPRRKRRWTRFWRRRGPQVPPLQQDPYETFELVDKQEAPPVHPGSRGLPDPPYQADNHPTAPRTLTTANSLYSNVQKPDKPSGRSGGDGATGASRSRLEGKGGE